MLTTPSPLTSTGELAGTRFPQLLCDENQIQNAHLPISIHIPGRKLSLHSDADFMRARRDAFPVDRAELEVLQCHVRFAAGFRLEPLRAPSCRCHSHRAWLAEPR